MNPCYLSSVIYRLWISSDGSVIRFPNYSVQTPVDLGNSKELNLLRCVPQNRLRHCKVFENEHFNTTDSFNQLESNSKWKFASSHIAFTAFAMLFLFDSNSSNAMALGELHAEGISLCHYFLWLLVRRQWRTNCCLLTQPQHNSVELRKGETNDAMISIYRLDERRETSTASTIRTSSLLTIPFHCVRLFLMQTEQKQMTYSFLPHTCCQQHIFFFSHFASICRLQVALSFDLTPILPFVLAFSHSLLIFHSFNF